MFLQTPGTDTTNDPDTLWHLEDHVFSCSLMATNTNHITVGIIKNGHLILKVSSTHAAFENGSRTVVQTKDKGDKVLRSKYSHPLQLFSGYLISTET